MDRERKKIEPRVRNKNSLFKHINAQPHTFDVTIRPMDGETLASDLFCFIYYEQCCISFVYILKI